MKRRRSHSSRHEEEFIQDDGIKKKRSFRTAAYDKTYTKLCRMEVIGQLLIERLNLRVA